MGIEDTGTLLEIIPLSGRNSLLLPPFSARGITQTLEPIDQSNQIYRTINGKLLDLTDAQFRKYHTEITCTDFRAPALSKAWQGQIVSLVCACEISWLTGDSPEREILSGSERTSGHFTFGRPVLTVMIININHGFDEWNAKYNWKLVAEENE